MKFKHTYLFIVHIICSFFLLSCTNGITKPTDNILLVHFIDVGQGDSILIQCNNKNMLIDCGPKESKDKLISYLQSNNIKTIDYFITTHPHEDHIGNASYIIDKYKIGEFLAPKVEHTNSSFEKMIESLVRKDLKIKVLKTGANFIDLGKDAKTTILSPSKSNYGDEKNNYSVMIKFEFKNVSFLFTGDAEKEVEKEVLNSNYNIESDVLKIGHHGSSTSTSKDFYKRVHPSIAVISVAKNNKYNHPDKNVLKLIKDSNATLYRTDLNGNIVLISDGNKISMLPYK